MAKYICLSMYRMPKIFGTQTTPPPGFTAEIPVTNPPPQGANGQGNEPPVEGADPGNEDGTPNTPDPSTIFNTQQNQGNEGGEQGNDNEGGGEQGNEGDDNNAQPNMEQVALDARQSALNAKESELAARESELAFKQQNSGEPEAEEPVISVFEEIDPEKLESDGERAILGAAKQVETKFNAQLTAAEKKVTVAEQKAQAATEKSENMELESNIKETCVKYSVTRGELETAYQQSSGLVRDLDTLAKSVLFDRAAANTGQQAQAQAKNERTQGAAKIGSAQGAQGANRNTDAEPRGNLKNVFDGAEIAKHYSAFA